MIEPTDLAYYESQHSEPKLTYVGTTSATFSSVIGHIAWLDERYNYFKKAGLIERVYP